MNLRQGWTGQQSGIDNVLDHLAARAGGAPHNWDTVATRLSGDAALARQFKAVYGEPSSPALLKDALSHFLRSLTTPSRFDRYLRGDQQALTAEEKSGYARFKSAGCVSCHQGINVGGNLFQRFGAMREPAAGAAIAVDQGRYALTGRESDRRMLRVPGLRNVALTAPYFHNGSVATLEEAVDAMFKYQLGRTPSEADKALVVRFLHTLSGEKMPPPGALP